MPNPVPAAAATGASSITCGRRHLRATLDPQQVRPATRYLLAELPLLLDTPGVAEVAASVFCYRQAPPFIPRRPGWPPCRRPRSWSP